MEWMAGRKNAAGFFLCQKGRQAGRLTGQTRRLDGWAIWPIKATTASVVYQREFISKGRGWDDGEEDTVQPRGCQQKSRRTVKINLIS